MPVPFFNTLVEKGISAMRTMLWAVAALAVLGSGCSGVGSGRGQGGGMLAQHSCPYCNREAAICQDCERQAAEQEMQLAAAQQQMQLAAAQQGIQLAAYNAGCPSGNCDPAAAGTAGGPDNYLATGGPYAGYGPYASYGPRPGRPGRPFDGGWYGPFGGAHRTPGYPKHHFTREYVGPQGPPTAQVAYPYYTIRGPRDFFLDNPPSIGR